MAQETQEFEIFKLDIKPKNGESLDIRMIYDKITIVESIFQNYILGQIDIIDSNSLIEELPILGEETIEMEIGYPTSSKRKKEKMELKGIVYKIDNRHRVGTAQSLEKYSLHFIHEISEKNKTLRISKTYKDGKISEYVSKIFNDSFPDVKIKSEQTEGKFEINIPNLSPISSINFLSKFAYKNEGKENLFYFYQDRDKFNFKSLEQMIKESESAFSEEKTINFEIMSNAGTNNKTAAQIRKYNQEQIKDIANTIDMAREKGEDDMADLLLETSGSLYEALTYLPDAKVILKGDESDVYQAEGYVLKNPFNNIESSDVGYFGFTNYANDILTKSSENVRYNYSEDFKKMPSLNPRETKDSDYEISENPHNTKIYSKHSYIEREFSEYMKEILGEDSPFIIDHFTEVRDPLCNTKKERFAYSPTFLVSMPGTFNLKLGEVANCKYPSFKVSGNTRERRYTDDKWYSGKYIISTITHTFFKGNTWQCDFELISDSIKDGKSSKKLDYNLPDDRPDWIKGL